MSREINLFAWRGQRQRYTLTGERHRECNEVSIRTVQEGDVCYRCSEGLRINPDGGVIFDASILKTANKEASR